MRHHAAGGYARVDGLSPFDLRHVAVAFHGRGVVATELLGGEHNPEFLTPLIGLRDLLTLFTYLDPGLDAHLLPPFVRCFLSLSSSYKTGVWQFRV